MRKQHYISIKIPVVVIMLITSFFLSSCSGNNAKDDKTFLSENGIALSAKAINTYKDLNNALRNQQYNNEMIRILNDPAPSSYLMNLNESKSEIIKDNINKQAAFGLLRKSFSAYNLFLDRNFDYKSSDLKNRLASSCSILDSFEVSDFFSERVQYLNQVIAGGRFKEDVVIMELAKLYTDLWNQDSQKWFMLLEDEMKNYREGVNKISNNSFDASKVKKLVTQPYSNEAVLINLYKLQLIKEKEQKANNLMDEIQIVTEGFEILTELNAELAKRKADKQRISELNNKLELIVN